MWNVHQCSFRQSSSFVLHRLSKPLRPFWVSPGNTSFPQLPPASDAKFFPVICVSASKLVEGEHLGGIERRAGYTYVQGSGDDHELWSQVHTGAILDISSLD